MSVRFCEAYQTDMPVYREKKRPLTDCSVRRRNIDSALPLLLSDIPITQPRHSRMDSNIRSFCERGQTALLKSTGFPITGEFRFRLLVCRSPKLLAGDSFPDDAVPSHHRGFSESIWFRKVLSCSWHWLFSIRFYYNAVTQNVNKKMEPYMIHSCVCPDVGNCCIDTIGGSFL